MRAVSVSAPREVQGFAAANELWLANLTGEPRRGKLNGARLSGLATLDAESFLAGAESPDALDRRERPFAGDEFELDAYAVARFRSARA
jgi:hypothetical protein